MKNIFRSIKNRVQFYFAKNKKYETEEEFYTFLFTKHPGWNSNKPNEDEEIRWAGLKSAIEHLKLSKTSTVLEIGCGRGWLANNLSAYGKVTAIDPIEPVIKYAQKLFPTIEFHAGILPVFRDKFPNRTFDLAVSTEVLEHITDKVDFLNHVYAMLKPGGHLVLTTPRMEHYDDFKEAFGIDPNQPVEDWVTEAEITELFVKTNFQILDKKFIAKLPLKDREVFITQLWVCRKPDA